MKNILLVLAFTGFTALLSSCGTDDDNIITIGATAVPHAEILEMAKPAIEALGYTLNIVIVDDFQTPNLFLADGDFDLNFFQHRPFLNNFNEYHGTDLVPVFGTHFEPLRLFSAVYTQISDVTYGSVITIPGDPVNEARALLLLEYIGLITLYYSNLEANATNTIASNPLNLVINPIDAAFLAPTLPDVDFAVVNGNFALQGGILDLYIQGAGEDPSSEAAITFTNYIVVRRGDEEKSHILAVIDAINRPEIRQFILDTYLGRVIPQF